MLFYVLSLSSLPSISQSLLHPGTRGAIRGVVRRGSVPSLEKSPGTGCLISHPEVFNCFHAVYTPILQKKLRFRKETRPVQATQLASRRSADHASFHWLSATSDHLSDSPRSTSSSSTRQISPRKLRKHSGPGLTGPLLSVPTLSVSPGSRFSFGISCPLRSHLFGSRNHRLSQPHRPLNQ